MDACSPNNPDYRMNTLLQDKLLSRIEAHPLTRLSTPENGIICRLHTVSDVMRKEISWLFEKHSDLRFLDGGSKINGWQLSTAWLDLTLGQAFMDPEPVGDRGDFMWNYLNFGYSLRDGGVGICAAPENFGKIAYCTFNAASDRGDIPIVANSFTEWIERTLDAGEDATCFYWQMPGFTDLGPAIPGDPNYTPLGDR
jgi:hypothetical protein